MNAWRSSALPFVTLIRSGCSLSSSCSASLSPFQVCCKAASFLLVRAARRFQPVLYEVVMKTYTRGISIRKFDALVVALSVSGVSKFEISRTCQQLDEQVIAVLGRLLNHAHFLNVYLGLHLPERLPRPEHAGGVMGGGGSDRVQYLWLQRDARFRGRRLRSISTSNPSLCFSGYCFNSYRTLSIAKHMMLASELN